MASVLLILASLLLFWLANDLNTTLGDTQITMAVILLGLGFFLWGILEAWSLATGVRARE